MTPYITLRWFTDANTGTAHSMTPLGEAACDGRIEKRWTENSYWKSGMPEWIRPCPQCEAILAGELP